MADPRKVRKEDSDDDDECIVEDMGSEEDGSDDEAEMDVNEEIQVDFEGFGITDSDFHGIKQMLQQLFPKDSVDVTELASLLIGQNFIGTVLKQSDFDEEMSDDSDELDQVFGVTSCLSLTGMPHPKEVLNHLLKFLSEKCETCASDDKMKAQFLKMFKTNKKEECIGWIINERFINIPPQVSLPMFEKLQSELEEASKRKHKTRYDFSHYIMICKTYQEAEENARKQEKSGNVQFINSEEELFMEESSAAFTYPIHGATSLMSGDWEEDSQEMMPCRTVLLLNKGALTTAMTKLQHHLSVLSKK